MESLPIKGSKAHLVPDEYRSSEITERSDIAFYLHTRPPISKTLAEYRDEIVKYVVWRFAAEDRGIGLVELNRRFYHTSAVFNLPASRVAQRLTSEGLLVAHRWGTSLVIFPPDYKPDTGTDELMHIFETTLRDSLDNGRTKPRKRRK